MKMDRKEYRRLYNLACDPAEDYTFEDLPDNWEEFGKRYDKACPWCNLPFSKISYTDHAECQECFSHIPLGEPEEDEDFYVYMRNKSCDIPNCPWCKNNFYLVHEENSKGIRWIQCGRCKGSGPKEAGSITETLVRWAEASKI